MTMANPVDSQKKKANKTSSTKPKSSDQEVWRNEVSNIEQPLPKKKKKKAKIQAEDLGGASTTSSRLDKPAASKKKSNKSVGGTSVSSSHQTDKSVPSKKKMKTTQVQSQKKTVLNQELDIFAPYASLHFNELNKVTFCEKVVNITKLIAKIGGNFVEIDPSGIILPLIWTIVKFLIDVVTVFFRFCANPLRILVEARDENGIPQEYFLITDKRSRFQRFMRWRQGDQLTLTTFVNQEVPLLVTEYKRSCCCIPNSCCGRRKTFEWRGVQTGEVMAYRQLRCPCYCTCNWLRCKDKVDYIECGNGDRMKFFVPRCSCCRREPNAVMAYTDKNEAKDVLKMAVKPYTGFSCQCALSFSDILDVLDAAKEGLVESYPALLELGMGVKGAIDDAKDLIDDVKGLNEAFKELKDNGFVKIENIAAKWDLAFQKNQNPYQKHASVLRVLEEYTKTRFS